MEEEQNKYKYKHHGGASGGWVVLFFIFLFIFSKWGPAIPFSVTAQQKGEPFMVTGQGKVSITPDIAKVNFGIEESGSSLKNLQNSVNQKSKNLTHALTKLGIKDEDIKTTSYNVYPQYDYTNSASRINGYQVTINYEVTINDFDLVNDALNAGTSAGANMIGGISFDVNEKTQKDKLNEARKMAVNDAKDKASGLAGAAGITLGKVINISENQSQSRPYPYLMSVDKATAGAPVAMPEADIKPGQTEINVSVSMIYEVR